VPSDSIESVFLYEQVSRHIIHPFVLRANQHSILSKWNLA
jgi:hypothetical protein